VRPAERAGGFLRIDGLAGAVLGEQAQQNRLDGAGIGSGGGLSLHARSHCVFAAGAQERPEFFTPGFLRTARFLRRN
jgi:hypothetical protein